MIKNPTRESDEADKRQLELATAQGKTYLKALDEMVNNEAAAGGKREVGEYLIGYAIEEAEGMYEWRDGELVWQNPTSENVHVEVAVADVKDGRFMPDLEVNATLVAADGREVATHRQPFVWHSWLYHYGRNWEVPESGMYTLRITVEAPRHMRHDKVYGGRHATPVTVEFEGVRIETGQKKA